MMAPIITMKTSNAAAPASAPVTIPPDFPIVARIAHAAERDSNNIESEPAVAMAVFASNPFSLARITAKTPTIAVTVINVAIDF